MIVRFVALAGATVTKLTLDGEVMIFILNLEHLYLWNPCLLVYFTVNIYAAR